MLTSGSPIASIPDGSLANTAVFAMGFGTGADVDYATLEALVAKGVTLGSTQSRSTARTPARSTSSTRRRSPRRSASLQ